jgi:short-subunit dehydrogenase
MTTALVTGPTSGLGRQFAIQLAAAGHDLILVSRDETRLIELSMELTSSYGTESEIIPTDLSDREQLAVVEARLADPTRPVGWLVNNAGFGLAKSFRETSVEDEQRLLDVLVTAPMRLTHAALPGMIERGFGRNIVVSSLASWVATGTYSAAKAWATVFVEGLQVEVANTGVNVTALCPGFVHTEFHARADMDFEGIPERMWLNPADVVATGIKDCEKGRVLSVPGRQYQALAHVARLSPRSVVRRFSAMR